MDISYIIHLSNGNFFGFCDCMELSRWKFAEIVIFSDKPEIFAENSLKSSFPATNQRPGGICGPNFTPAVIKK